MCQKGNRGAQSEGTEVGEEQGDKVHSVGENQAVVSGQPTCLVPGREPSGETSLAPARGQANLVPEQTAKRDTRNKAMLII